jgi:predicted dehydrogenase
MDKTRIGLVGCGRIAETHLQALQTIEEAQVVGTADTNKYAADRMASAVGCAAYADFQVMIENERPEIVVVCTPPATHEEVAVGAVRRGAHVLCEKPFAIDTGSASRMVHAAKQAGRFITMASKFRFVDDVSKAKELVQSGVIGKMVLCEIAFCGRVDMRGRWNSQPEISGGGVMIDNGSHAVDVVRFLLGPIGRVQAQHGRSLQDLRVEDTSMIFVETTDGVWGRIDLSWSMEKDQDSYICMHGSEGMLVVGWKGSRYRRYDKPEWVSFGTGYDKIAAFRRQHKNFLDCVRGQAAAVINSEDSFESVRVIEVGYWSARANKWLEMDGCLTR